MAYSFNPFTGRLDDVGSGGGGATLGANTFTATQSITAPVNTSALTASYSVTGANTTPILNLSGTWNTTGIANGILLNVTDTASAGISLLLDLQAASTSRFRVTKMGTVTTASIYATNFVIGGNASIIGATGLALGSNASILWKNNANVELGTSDLFLYRDAANTLALRNGTNAQTFRLYNTFTDASNYERGFMRWNSNTLEIGSEAGGTGTNTREVSLIAGGNTFLKLSPPASRIISSYGISPASDNAASLGLAALRWSNIFTKGIVQNGTIGTTLTPASNGDLQIEQTSNTSITFKMKGTDGTVRSASLTLA